MSRWVKQEYEGALSFLFIIVTALLPWNFAYATAGEFGRVISFYWWVGELRYIEASDGLNEWYWVHDSILLQEGHSVYSSLLVGGVGTVVFIAAFLLAIVLFVNEDAIESHVPIRYVAGGLLLFSGVCFLAASLGLAMNGLDGYYIPVGAIFQVLFGGVLLTNRTGVQNQEEDTPTNETVTVEPEAE